MKRNSDILDVSIIIVNWNTRDILRNCLNTVYQQTNGVNFEVIVIDNASSDSSAGMVKKEFPRAVLIENRENKGFAAANNQGIKIAHSRYVLLLNSDTIVLSNAIAKAVCFADVNHDVAVVGCRVLNPDGTLQASCFKFPSILNLLLSVSYLYKLFPANRFFGRERMSFWQRDDVRQVDVVTGCFMLVRRRAIEQVGLMDENFFMYAEEADWCYRFKQAGWTVMFTPVSEIIHLGGRSSQKVREQMIITLRLSILRFINKHYGWLKYKTACLLIALFFIVRLPVWFMVGVFSPNRRKQAALRLRAYFNGAGRVLFNSQN